MTAISLTLKPKEQIVQLIVWNNGLYGLSNEGRIFQCAGGGDLKYVEHLKWRLVMGSLQEVFSAQ